jgi:uncharacterized protein (TIGR03437 family)
MNTTSLSEGGVVPPQVAIGGKLAGDSVFRDAPGYPGYFQVNLRVPNGAAPGSAVSVRCSTSNVRATKSPSVCSETWSRDFEI